MGCGKSTVGRRLASLLGRRFVDMDTYIEEQAHLPVRAIFEAEGESGFRRREHDACVTLGRQEGLVLATGGGAVLSEDNREALCVGGVLVWLRIEASTVLERLKDDRSRPLLQRDDKATAVVELLAARTPLYTRAADLIVDADRDPDTVAAAVLDALAAKGFL